MKNYKKYIMFSFAILSLSKVGYANRDPFKDIEMTQRLLELQQQQRYIDEQLKYPNRIEGVKREEPSFQVEDGKKYLFKHISVIGGEKYKRKIQTLIKQYENTEMGKTEIYELMSKLSNVYLTNGYTTTIVTIKSGNIHSGELIYEVKEGKVRNISVKGKDNTLRDKMKIFTAFPTKKDKLLNVHDIDQGIENMNIGGWNNTMQITPTEEYGYSDILIEQNYSTTGISVGVNNSGYQDKGRNKANISFIQGNLLGLNDRISFNYIERLTKNREYDKEANYDIGYSVPIGYWNISYNYNLGDNYNTSVTNIGEYKSESKIEKHKIKLQRVLFRGQSDKTTFNTGIVMKNNFNTMNGLKLDVTSKKYTSFTIGLDHVNKLWGGSIFTGIEYEKGIPWFGGEGDREIKTPGAYKNEYNKVNLNLDWQRMIKASENHIFQYKFGMGASYSPDRLASSNQFSMGDEYTVRGFKESSVSGNKGIYINNTLTYIPSGKLGPIISMFKPFIGLDGGVSRDRDLSKDDKIAGLAMGVKFNYGYINSSLTYSMPLKMATGMPKEGNPIYFNVSYSL